jgi:hypothetical protein
MKTLYESILSTSKAGKEYYLPEQLAELFYKCFPKLIFDINLDKSFNFPFVSFNGGVILYDEKYENNVKKFKKGVEKLGLYTSDFEDTNTSAIFDYRGLYILKKRSDTDSLICICCSLGKNMSLSGKYTRIDDSPFSSGRTYSNSEFFLRFVKKLDELYNKK